MNYWFFFSYAHADQDDFLNTFYNNLAKEVRGLTGAKEPESGFIDRNGIEHGADWDKTLEKALQSCRVFVPIYTPSYFNSVYCGKEFNVFRDRLHKQLKQQGSDASDPLILPVLWNQESNVLEKIPAAIDKIQYKHGDYPKEYLTEGVLQMVRLGVAPNSSFYNQYWDFVRKFANTIYTAAKKFPLPPAPSLTSLANVKSLFSPVTGTTSGEAGPRYVQFIFVAGNQTELQRAQRSELKFYGPQGGADWQPYLDTYKGNARALAIEAVEAIKDMHYEEVVLSPGTKIVEQIQQAESQSKIVVVMVDTWTLRLQSYHQMIAPLDNYSSVNCITLILWNDEDQEAGTYKTTLEAAVEGTFTTKYNLTDQNFFHTSITSSAAFKSELIRALVEAQSKIVNTAKVRQKLKYALVKQPTF